MVPERLTLYRAGLAAEDRATKSSSYSIGDLKLFLLQNLGETLPNRQRIGDAHMFIMDDVISSLNATFTHYQPDKVMIDSSDATQASALA